jgi:hypothetical protein
MCNYLVCSNTLPALIICSLLWFWLALSSGPGVDFPSLLCKGPFVRSVKPKKKKKKKNITGSCRKSHAYLSITNLLAGLLGVPFWEGSLPVVQK